ncbi:MAG: hypothetical protein K8F91_08520 [Candidatus Obscuribacterales bacterium]|nr:hypothetical protein [Candidatus Obscuribacterales bacterium]
MPKEISLDLLSITDPYPEKIRAVINSEKFLDTLLQSIDTSTEILTPGYVPGTKAIGGSVTGANFLIRKNGFLLNPFSRSIYGRVLDQKDGSLVEYKLSHKPGTILIAVILTIALSGLAALSLFALYQAVTSGYVFAGNVQAMISAYFWAISPLIVLFVLSIIWKLGCHSGYADEEELLDHIRKISAGIFQKGLG